MWIGCLYEGIDILRSRPATLKIRSKWKTFWSTGSSEGSVGKENVTTCAKHSRNGCLLKRLEVDKVRGGQQCRSRPDAGRLNEAS